MNNDWKCLLEIGAKLGIAPEGQSSADRLTGRILERLETGGEHAELVKCMLDQLEVMLKCNAEGQEHEETVDVLRERHTVWCDLYNNIRKYGVMDPSETIVEPGDARRAT